MRILLASLLAITLTGCATGTIETKPTSQPRALQWGAGNPFCLFLCFATATATDAEGNGSATGGAVSQSGSLSVGTPSAVPTQ
jgi:hypothetical protein